MPRKHSPPIVYLALSPAMVAASFGIPARSVYAEIENGRLIVRTLPGSRARKVFVGPADQPGTVEFWARTYWIQAPPRKPRKIRKVPHV